MTGALALAGSRGLPQRLFWLVALLAVEWLPLSAVVHTERGGASLARFLIAFAAFFLILGYSHVRGLLPGISAELDSPGIGGLWLAAHAGALFIFVLLSFTSTSGFPPLLSAALWFTSGIGAIAMGTLAFIPPATARRLILGTGHSWVYALVGGAAAWSLVPFAWSYWNSPHGQALTGVTFDFVHVLMRNVLPDVAADRARLVIGTPRFTVEIGTACSGFEGLTMMLVFGLLWLVFFRREIRFPQALLLVPAGLLLMWVLNAVRIAVLIAIGHFGAPSIAMGGFHSQAGWIAFTGVTLAYASAL